VDLQITVLGSAGSHTGVGRVCSGYLVQAGGTSVLLDAGNGSTANLQRHLPLRDLDAIVISHRHIDHCIDLIGGFYALRFDPAFAGRQLPLYAAAEVYDTLTGLLSGDSQMAFGEVYDHQQVGHGDQIEVGPLALSFASNIHPPPTVATRIEVGGSVLVYSADTAGGDALVEHARGADLFLCEATWPGDAQDWPPGIHLTGRGAGAVATQAGVKRLVLTHIAGGSDRQQILREAGETYDGPIELAEDLTTYTVE
jgi:ribonuclease BN (tRNA processing enzyme)